MQVGLYCCDVRSEAEDAITGPLTQLQLIKKLLIVIVMYVVSMF